MELRLDPAAMDDAADLLAWRNDPATRARSRQGGEIDWDGHCRWLAAMIVRPDCLFLVARADGARCGTVRFARVADGAVWEVSIALAPSWRGRGIGGRILRLGIERLRAAHPGAAILAAAPGGNAASAALFRRAGFAPVPSDEEFEHYLLGA